MAKARKKNKVRYTRNRGALSALALLLVLSAFTRLSDHAGQAFALDAQTSGEPKTPSALAPSVTPAPTPDTQLVLQALSNREARVAEAERQIRLRMAALQEADVEIKNRLQELRSAEAALRATLALADEAADKDITRLVAVYENMKPKEAAALFETMQPSFAAGFLGRMNPQAAAGVMAGLNPDIAHAISVELAGRNAEVPTE